MEHSHGGDATYIAYAQGCRHSDCLVAFNDYKLRLAQRKLSGDYVDLRRRENQLRDLTEQFAEQHRPVAPDPAPSEPEPVVETRRALPAPPVNPPPDTAATDDSGPVEEMAESGVVVEPVLSATAQKVLKYLTVIRMSAGGKLDSARAKINMTMLSQMPIVIQLTQHQCQAALDELENAGWLAGDGKDIFLIEPGTATTTAPAPAPNTAAPSTPRAVYVEGRGIQWVGA